MSYTLTSGWRWALWNNLLRINLYLGLWVLGRNDPKLGADRPRSWGGSTEFGADVGRIDPGRIDSGAYRPVPFPIGDPLQPSLYLYRFLDLLGPNILQFPSRKKDIIFSAGGPNLRQRRGPRMVALRHLSWPRRDGTCAESVLVHSSHGRDSNLQPSDHKSIYALFHALHLAGWIQIQIFFVL